jgi:mono/diheme cytochrome c family protein/plastocyanin
MIDPVQAAVGIVVLLVTVGGLLYIFYSRTNAVEKTGYGALIMLSIVSLMIPVFWIMETDGQLQATIQQNNVAVSQGAALYALYCVQCHGVNGQGAAGPRLNGNSAVNSLSDTDLMRIIEAGIPNANNPSQLLMPAWSDQYGGPLSNPQVQYLFALIRSADPAYLSANHLPSGPSGFDQVPAALQLQNPTGYQTAVAQATSGAGTGQFGPATDETTSKAVTINIVNTLTGFDCQPSCYALPNIKVKVGTTITWVNQSSAPHTVTATRGTNPGSEVADPTVFDSTLARPITANGGTFSWTVTMAAYNANPNHVVIYYCGFHPAMLAMMTIVP